MELANKKKETAEAEFADNNFWRIDTPTPTNEDIDRLVKELEEVD